MVGNLFVWSLSSELGWVEVKTQEVKSKYEAIPEADRSVAHIGFPS